jgi:signal transduction histidine kinase
VNLQAIDDRFVLTVKDNGIGIPENEQKHLFERFYRANNAANIQGTGIGLNIIKKYIELLNGNITFTSKLNEGTTFTINLPLTSNII